MEYVRMKKLLEMKHEVELLALEYRQIADTYTRDDKEYVLEVKKAEIKLKEYQLLLLQRTP